MDHKTKDRITSYVTSAVLLIASLFFGYKAIGSLSSWIGRDKKIDTLAASSGLTELKIQGMIGCVGKIKEECKSAPISEGKVLLLYMGEMETIGGKWRGKEPTIISDLLISGKPVKMKDWGSSMSQQPTKKSVIKVQLTVQGVGEIHSFHSARVAMRVVYPYFSGTFEFQNGTKDFESTLQLFSVTPEEFKLMKSIQNASEDSIGFLVIFIITMALSYLFFWSARNTK